MRQANITNSKPRWWLNKKGCLVHIKPDKTSLDPGAIIVTTITPDGTKTISGCDKLSKLARTLVKTVPSPGDEADIILFGRLACIVTSDPWYDGCEICVEVFIQDIAKYIRPGMTLQSRIPIDELVITKPYDKDPDQMPETAAL